MNVQEKVIEIIAATVKERVTLNEDVKITPDFSLAQVESLALTEAIIGIEEAFNLAYTPQPEIDKMRTVQDVINYVTFQLPCKNSA